MSDPLLTQIYARLDRLERKTEGLKEACIAIARIEERQTNLEKLAYALERELQSNRDRVTAVEVQQPSHSRTDKLVDKAVYAAAGMLAMYVLKVVGVL
jgi:chromosome segregation ATPase